MILAVIGLWLVLAVRFCWRHRGCGCGSDCAHTMPAADLAVINRIAALGDLRGEMPELRKRYPRLDMTTWTRENRVQA